MKLISWNVNGIRAVVKKGFLDFVETEKQDILCIQETKAHPSQVDDMLKEYEHHFWNSAEKKGYSGTAVFSKIKPALTINFSEYFKDFNNHIINFNWNNTICYFIYLK